MNSSIATRRWFGTAIYLQFGRRMHRMFDAMHGGHVTFKVTHYLWIILFWESKCLTACNFSAPSDALLMPVSSAVHCTKYMCIEYISHSFSVSLSIAACIWTVHHRKMVKSVFFRMAVTFSNGYVWTSGSVYISSFVCTSKWLICIMGAWHHCYSDARMEENVLSFATRKCIIIWQRESVVCVCYELHQQIPSKRNIHSWCCVLLMASDLINI